MPTTTSRRWPGAGSSRKSTERVKRACGLLALCLAGACGADVAAQPASMAQGPQAGAAPAAIQAEPAGQPATVTFFNRPIVVLRARVLGRSPAERAEGAGRARDDLIERG